MHVQVWREAYAGLLPAEYLAALDPTFGPTRWRERFGTSPDLGWWVARDEEGIVGHGHRRVPPGTTTHRCRSSCTRSTCSGAPTGRVSPTS